MNENKFSDDAKEFLWRLDFNTSNSDEGPFKYTSNGFSIFIAKHENGFIAHAHDDENIIDACAIGEDASQVVKDVINQWHEKFMQASVSDAAVQSILGEITQFEQEKMMQQAEEEMHEQEIQMMENSSEPENPEEPDAPVEGEFR